MSAAVSSSVPASTSEYVEVAAPATTVCWHCRGVGWKHVKDTHAPPEAKREPGQPILKRIPCRTCAGMGAIPRAKRTKKDPSARVHAFGDFTPPGPSPQPRIGDADLEARAGEDLSFLTGKWRLFQEHASHRYSTDDVVTAWVAWRVARLLSRRPQAAATVTGSTDAPGVALASPPPMRCLDIGCGIGSVLLMTAWLHPHAACTGVEAQPSRASQAWRSTRYNGCTDRVRVFNGDLRDPAVFESAPLGAAAAGGAGGSGSANSASSGSATSASDSSAAGALHGPLFDLITGTPPYFDVTTGSPGLPSSEESARCLFEYRGGVEAYTASAARWLAPGGLFVVVGSSQGWERGYKGAADAGLRVLARVDTIPKVGKPSLFSIWVMCRPDAPYIPVGVEAPATAAGSSSGASAEDADTSTGAGCSPKEPSAAGAAVASAKAVASCSTDAADAVAGMAAGTSAASAPRGAGSAAAPSAPGCIIPFTLPLFAEEGCSPYGPAEGIASDAAAADEDAACSAAGSSASPEKVGDAPPAEDAAAAAPEAAAASAAAAAGDASGPAAARMRKQQKGRDAAAQKLRPMPGSVTGEIVYTLTVRGSADERTPAYRALLLDLGKPG